MNHTYNQILARINILSDAIVLLDQQGEVYASNKAFEQYASSYSLGDLTPSELSRTIIDAFADNPLPFTSSEQTIYSSIKDTNKQQHHIGLHPCFFTDIHAVLFKKQDADHLFQKVLDCIPSRVFWKDTKGNYLGCNNLFASDCGLQDSKEVIGHNDYHFFPDTEADDYLADDQQVISSAKPKLHIEESLTRPNGEVRWLETNKVPITNQAQDIIGIMGSYTDITERKLYQEIIEEKAHQDQLTKLHNRQALQEHFQALENNPDYQYGSLLFIDLDDFKTANDTLGHAVGDKLLKLVAGRIKNTANDHGFVVRLGGDEFSVMLIAQHNETEVMLKVRTQQLANTIKNAVIQAYQVESHYIQIGVSIGITYFYAGNIDWVNTFKEADMAMYNAKETGKNTIKVFSEAIRNKHNEIIKIQSMLNTALMNNELYLAIQPQFNNEQKLIGAEALLRWNNHELGEIHPEKFIPISEQSGTINTIGMWVFKQAFRMMKQWSDDYGEENLPPLAVNVSVKQFQNIDFLNNIKSLLAQYPVNPKLIHFELTESLLVESEAEAIAKLSGLSQMGFPLAIDDFGTGYSCLSYLNQLPIDKIKIDKAFTFQITQDQRQAALVETIINMAKNLDMKVIAEGVETQQQLEFLLQRGCSEFQGYYFSEPISHQDYTKLLVQNM